MADLSPLTYGTIVGRFLAIVGDAADGGEDPDYEAMEGTVTITASINSALVINADPVPATLLMRPIVCTLDVDGYLEWNGVQGVNVIATDDPNMNPTDFTYTATFDLSHAGSSVPYTAFSFEVEAGTEVDLTLVTPVISSPGTVTIVGPAGPPGSGINWLGPWSSVTAYVEGDAVENDGSSYMAIADNTNSEPPSANWELIAAAGSGAAWGSIGGTLSAQTDLQTALDGKVDEIADPGADRLRGWDDSATAEAYFELLAPLTVSGTQIDVATATTSAEGVAELATDAEAQTATATDRVLTPSNIPSFRGLYNGLNAQTGTTYTVVLADLGKLVTCSNASPITVTLPQNSDVAFPIGTQIDFLVIAAGMVTFAAGTGATVNATPSAVTRAQYSAATAIKVSTNGWVVVGDLA